jgi:hypothetical protein
MSRKKAINGNIKYPSEMDEIMSAIMKVSAKIMASASGGM